MNAVRKGTVIHWKQCFTLTWPDGCSLTMGTTLQHLLLLLAVAVAVAAAAAAAMMVAVLQ